MSSFKELLNLIGWAPTQTTNRAKVVAKPQPSIARLLATGALSRECLTAQRKISAQQKIYLHENLHPWSPNPKDSIYV